MVPQCTTNCWVLKTHPSPHLIRGASAPAAACYRSMLLQCAAATACSLPCVCARLVLSLRNKTHLTKHAHLNTGSALALRPWSSAPQPLPPLPTQQRVWGARCSRSAAHCTCITNHFCFLDRQLQLLWSFYNTAPASSANSLPPLLAWCIMSSCIPCPTSGGCSQYRHIELKLLPPGTGLTELAGVRAHSCQSCRQRVPPLEAPAPRGTLYSHRVRRQQQAVRKRTIAATWQSRS